MNVDVGGGREVRGRRPSRSRGEGRAVSVERGNEAADRDGVGVLNLSFVIISKSV